MIALLFALALQTPLPPPTVAPPMQEKPAILNKIVRPKYEEADVIFESLRIFAKGWVAIDVNLKLNAISISGPEKEVADIEALIASLDQPKPAAAQIEFRIRLVGASDNPKEDARDKLDDELKGVVAKLSKHFKLASVWEIDSVLGRCEAGTQMDLTAGGPDQGFRIMLHTDRLMDKSIHIRSFDLRGDGSLTTALTIKEGETTVVGLTRGQSGKSVIAVITATVEK